MNVSFNKAAIAATASVAVLVLTTAAIAVSPGYPKGRPYFGSQQHSMARSYNYYSAPSYSAPAEDTRQSFSHEPTESAAQDQSAQAAQPQHEAHVQRPTVRRSYSYEPSQPMQWRSSGRRMGAGRDRWLLQKTDPRRIEL